MVTRYPTSSPAGQAVNGRYYHDEWWPANYYSARVAGKENAWFCNVSVIIFSVHSLNVKNIQDERTWYYGVYFFVGDPIFWPKIQTPDPINVTKSDLWSH